MCDNCIANKINAGAERVFMTDTWMISCASCGKKFELTWEERNRYEKAGQPHRTHCKECSTGVS